jgi:hypothetical protein
VVELPDRPVELTDAIAAVRQQLVAAQLAGRQVVAGRVLTFAVGKVELELTGEIRWVAGGSAGAKFWVLSADTNAERSSGHVHKIKVELIPEGPDGDTFRVSGELDAPPSQ